MHRSPSGVTAKSRVPGAAPVVAIRLPQEGRLSWYRVVKPPNSKFRWQQEHETDWNVCHWDVIGDQVH